MNVVHFIEVVDEAFKGPDAGTGGEVVVCVDSGDAGCVDYVDGDGSFLSMSLCQWW